jgi:hypothetical protein
METSLFGIIYKVSPFLYTLLAGFVAFVGVMGRARTSRPGWSMIMIAGVLFCIKHVVELLVQYRLVSMLSEGSIYFYTYGFLLLEFLAWVFLAVGLFLLVNERKSEGSIG